MPNPFDIRPDANKDPRDYLYDQSIKATQDIFKLTEPENKTNPYENDESIRWWEKQLGKGWQDKYNKMPVEERRRFVEYIKYLKELRAKEKMI